MRTRRGLPLACGMARLCQVSFEGSSNGRMPSLSPSMACMLGDPLQVPAQTGPYRMASGFAVSEFRKMRLYAWHIAGQRVCFPLLLANLAAPAFIDDTESGTGFLVTMALFVPMSASSEQLSEPGTGYGSRSHSLGDVPFTRWLQCSWPR